MRLQQLKDLEPGQIFNFYFLGRKFRCVLVEEGSSGLKAMITAQEISGQKRVVKGIFDLYTGRDCGNEPVMVRIDDKSEQKPNRFYPVGD